MEREVESGPVGKVGDDHGIWAVRAKLVTIRNAGNHAPGVPLCS
jgi:hypothetical protein